MDNQNTSFLIRCSKDLTNGANRLQIVQVDTAQEIFLSESVFLLRVSTDDATTVERCYLRHLASGREVYMQSGKGLRAFLKDCLLEQNDTGNSSPEANHK